MLEIGVVLSESVERDAIELVPVDVETTELESDVLCHEELVEQLFFKHDSSAFRLGIVLSFIATHGRDDHTNLPISRHCLHTSNDI